MSYSSPSETTRIKPHTYTCKYRLRMRVESLSAISFVKDKHSVGLSPSKYYLGLNLRIPGDIMDCQYTMF